VLILSPGPANITDGVRAALTQPDIGHRDSEFRAILRDVRAMLLEACGVSSGYRCAVMTGSGTTGIESSLTAMKGVTNGILILANGSYGERAAKVASVFDLPHETMNFGWTGQLDLDEIDAKCRSTDADTVYLIHHETTTGVLNPLKEIAAIGKRHNKWVMVDAVSSVCGEELDMAGWGVDLIMGSANKCIRGVPGAGFVVVNEQLASVMQDRRQATFVTDLVSHLEQEEKGETPFTPAVQVFAALRVALEELLEEGVENRIAHYERIATALRDGLAELGLELLLPREWYSNTMTSINMPEGFTYDRLHDELKDQGYLIYNAQGSFQEKMFRLGTVGVMTEDDIRGFLNALGSVLAK
tara:strand:- start:1611 stop:2681 length:1071 start_codon:yes stop_codon:yes gene_type:complete